MEQHVTFSLDTSKTSNDVTLEQLNNLVNTLSTAGYPTGLLSKGENIELVVDLSPFQIIRNINGIAYKVFRYRGNIDELRKFIRTYNSGVAILTCLDMNNNLNLEPIYLKTGLLSQTVSIGDYICVEDASENPASIIACEPDEFYRYFDVPYAYHTEDSR